ncbi:MAG: DHHA1 domain-containing protein [Candidatus Hodarchaeota archaeon]
MKQTFWLATHGSDLDGISCGALIIRAHPGYEFKINFLSVHEAQHSEDPYDLCTDIPKSPNAKRNIDHHSTNLEKLRCSGRLGSKDIVDPSAPSAASLVFRAYKMDSDPIAQQIVTLANSADTGKLHREFSEYQVIENIIRGYPFDQQILYKLTKLYAHKGKEILDDLWVQEKYLEIAEDLNQAKNVLNNFFSAVSVPEFLILDFIDLVQTKHYKQTFGPAFRAGARVLAVVYENPRDKSFQVSFRVHNEMRGKVDVRRVAEDLGGGGHAMAAGARSEDKKSLIQRIQKAFQEIRSDIAEDYKFGILKLEA